MLSEPVWCLLTHCRDGFWLWLAPVHPSYLPLIFPDLEDWLEKFPEEN